MKANRPDLAVIPKRQILIVEILFLNGRVYLGLAMIRNIRVV